MLEIGSLTTLIIMVVKIQLSMANNVRFSACCICGQKGVTYSWNIDLGKEQGNNELIALWLM